MAAYYNEFDPFAAAWLRNLIALGWIAPGDVDERSIKDVQPDDLRGYTQAHFFAGIGGWSFAARLAGWPDDRPLWTGSCPCQPFSNAGQGGGVDDPRHLWPDFFRLIRAIRPPVVMGEQVAGALGYGWFDHVSADLAGEGFASRTVDIASLALDGDQIRNRLCWLAVAGRRPVEHPGRFIVTPAGALGWADDPVASADSQGFHRDGLGHHAGQTGAGEGQGDQRERLWLHHGQHDAAGGPRGNDPVAVAHGVGPEMAGDPQRQRGPIGDASHGVGAGPDDADGARAPATVANAELPGRGPVDWAGNHGVDIGHGEAAGREQGADWPGNGHAPEQWPAALYPPALAYAARAGWSDTGHNGRFWQWGYVGVGDPGDAGLEGQRGHVPDGGEWPQQGGPVAAADGGHWIICHDDKARRLPEPGFPLLASAVSGRVAFSDAVGSAAQNFSPIEQARLINRMGAWKGLGNAIDPVLMSQAIIAYMETGECASCSGTGHLFDNPVLGPCECQPVTGG